VVYGSEGELPAAYEYWIVQNLPPECSCHDHVELPLGSHASRKVRILSWR
jgi:hypothetical protein